jgi:formylglycine-generating enzyme
MHVEIKKEELAPEAENTKLFDLFIVYAPEDTNFVRDYFLPGLRLPTSRVLLVDELTPGALIASEIERGVSCSRFTIAVLSPAYLKDRWACFGEQLASYLSLADVHVIPLRLVDCKLPLRLEFRIALDFRSPDHWESEIARLRELLRSRHENAGVDNRSGAPLATNLRFEGLREPSTASVWARRRTRVIGFTLFALLTLTAMTMGIIRLTARSESPPSAALTSMIRFNGGYYTMGRTQQELEDECHHMGAVCRKDALEREQPPRRVRLSAFFLDIHEVTNQEFADWLNIDTSQFTIEDDGPKRPKAHVNDNHGVLLLDLYPVHLGIELDAGPQRYFAVRSGYQHKAVVQVTWDAARRFCEAKGKRLPTEAEWEFAARGNTSRRYPWGNEEPRCDGVVLGREGGAPCAGFPSGPATVASASQDWTVDHVADLGGNVTEWVFDAFTLPYYPPCGECFNPKQDHPLSNGEDLRVVRGGSWGSFAFARTSARGRWKREATADNIGFRCAVNDQ